MQLVHNVCKQITDQMIYQHMSKVPKYGPLCSYVAIRSTGLSMNSLLYIVSGS